MSARNSAPIPSPLRVAAITRRHKVRCDVVVPVVVKMIGDQGINVFGITLFPGNYLAAPMARVTTWADGVVQGGAVNEHAPACHRQWVPAQHALTITPVIDDPDRVGNGAPRPHALVVHIAETVLRVRPLASLDIAVFLVAIVADIAVVLQAPEMHLTQAAPLVLLLAAGYFAKHFSLGPWGASERVTVQAQAAVVRHAETLGIDPVFAAWNGAFTHA